MLDYITKPTGDAITDLSNAEEHLSVAEAGDLNGGEAGTFDIYVRIAGTVSITTGNVLTAANDSDEAEFFYTGNPGGNIGVDIASGSYAGTYTTDYLGSTFTLADVQSAPVCLVAPTVSGNTGNGDTLTILPSLWIYDGPAIAPLTRQQKIDGVNVSIEDGGDELTYTIDIAQVSEQDFTVAETFGGTTVTSAPTTIDTFTGSWMGFDTGAKFRFDPAEIILDGSNNVLSWPNTSNGGSNIFDLDAANNAMPTWDAANSKLVGNGVDQGLRTGITGDQFTLAGGYSLFFVADASTSSNGADTVIFTYGEHNDLLYVGLGQSGGDLVVYVRDAGAKGVGFGQVPSLTLINASIPAGKHLFELRVTGETLVEVFIDGSLQYSQTMTAPKQAGTRLEILSGGPFNMPWYSDAAIYEMFCTLSTGEILDNIRGELATKHSITLA